MVRGRRGKRVLRRLCGDGEGDVGDGERGYALDGWDHIFVAENDEVLNERLAGVWRERAREKMREMRRKIGGFFRVANGDLCDERDELSKVVRVVVVWADVQQLANAVVVIVLLQKFFLVPSWIALDEILQLRQIRGEEGSS